ncbi:MAG TPA: DMT family transporter [Enhygromyxa sp.]|nr:DMT family transporter [Enhygromyxa sp.]
MSGAGTWIAIGCGLGAALCFGVGDYLAQRLTHRHGAMSAMFAVQVASLLVLATIGAAWYGAPRAAPEQVAAVIGIGLVNTLGMVGLYRAFETGKLSLVSPIAGSMGAFAVVFAWLAGTPPPAVVIPGLFAVVLGIVAASTVDEPTPKRGASKLGRALGVGWALLSALGFGWVFSVLGQRSVALGPVWTIAILRLVAIVLLIALAKPLRVRPTAALGREQPSSRGRTLAIACLDSGGMVLVALGGAAEPSDAAVVAVLASSFPLITIALARVYLREGLRWWQWIGVALVLVGVAWVSAIY